MEEEAYPMKGGDDTFSYAKNSDFQKEASNVANGMIWEAITEKFNFEDFLSPTATMSAAPTIRIADLGCSVGPNTFTAMQNVIDNLETKYKTLPYSLQCQKPQLQVFFNDHVGNDFNTLFKSLPSDKSYFSCGVPRSFYGRLFPDSSLHFIHSSYALQWLSKAPVDLLVKDSKAWNGGRIHYMTSAPQEVVDAYASQFSKDMGMFLEHRAQELVVGGMMVLIMPCIPSQNVSFSQVPLGIVLDLLGASLFDMVKAGVIAESQVDTFNLPMYATSPEEMELVVAKNGHFHIAKMELSNPASSSAEEAEEDGVSESDGNDIVRHLRASMEGVLSKHFGVEVMDELFDRFFQKTLEFSDRISSWNMEGTQMFIALVKHK